MGKQQQMFGEHTNKEPVANCKEEQKTGSNKTSNLENYSSEMPIKHMGSKATQKTSFYISCTKHFYKTERMNLQNAKTPQLYKKLYKWAQKTKEQISYIGFTRSVKLYNAKKINERLKNVIKLDSAIC